ncbi:PAS domain-containing protein [Streptomyces nodosus]|uniref:Uncharacterized protein n=1 Tax=Streptomyces nodosus TaxID=40318 RepID=A0A0B5DT70_9ACTN|nr:PAS domain-containing protein [Streptomyces nodosus]AJE44465.1 hypothetical protein SNOD_34165 [Streptomyces nodosus]MBB4796123.1 PAS domain S-box-containing protein [Streptomyces nodosus]
MPHAVLDGLSRHSPIGVSAFDSELRYLHVNTALETINGVPEVRHLGRRPSEVLPEVNGAEVETVMQRVLDTGEPVVDFRTTGRTTRSSYEDRVVADRVRVREFDDEMRVGDCCRSSAEAPARW